MRSPILLRSIQAATAGGAPDRVPFCFHIQADSGAARSAFVVLPG